MLRKSIENRVKLWDEAIRQASNKKVGIRLLRDKRRWLCRNDLYYLAKLTGHSFWKQGAIKGFVDRFHRPFCDSVSLMNWKVVQLNMMPPSEGMLKIEEVADEEVWKKLMEKLQRLYIHFRSAYKTTIVTTLHTIQLILNFPELHIAISHNTQDNASEILMGIKNLFLNSELSRLFPEYIPKTREWGNKTGFSVACRKDFIMKGDNIEAIGVGTQVVGRKYHLFKNDDIVTDKSVTNAEQLKQSRDYLEYHKSLFVNPSVRLEDYSGTKYHHADAYATLEENPNVEVNKETLLKQDPQGTLEWDSKKWRCILPELFSDKGVRDLMSNAYIFSCQYMLNPSDPKKTKFTEEMIQTYQHVPDGLTRYLLIDSADSLEKRACYTAMEVWGIDHEENWYLLDAVFDKLDDRDRIDESIRLAIKWRVYEVLWEILSYGRTDQRNFERASRLVPDGKRTWTTPRIIKASEVSKDDRILGLNDRYSRHQVFWPPTLMYYSKFEGKNIDIIKALEYEFLYFPLVSHKDLLDCNSFLLQIDLIKGDKSKTPEPSKFAHIKDPVQRGNTEVFWHNFPWDCKHLESPPKGKDEPAFVGVE